MNSDLDNGSFNSNEIRSRARTMYEMSDCDRSVNGSSASSSTFVDKPIRREDSLQNIAIKYGVKVVDLKRANNLLSDQDFFALTSIKIPMPRGSIREELVEQEAAQLTSTSNRNTSDTYIGNNQSDDSDWENDILANSAETRRLLQRDEHVTTTVPLSIGDDFLKRIDENVHTASLSASRQELRVQDVISNLGSTPLTECSWESVRSSHVPSGISWPVMIAAAVFTAVVVPVCILLLVYWHYYTPTHYDDVTGTTYAHVTQSTV